MKKIDSVCVLTLGTSAQTVRVSGLAADNGWRLAPGERTPVPFTALDLSLVASAAGTDVRVLLLDEL